MSMQQYLTGIVLSFVRVVGSTVLGENSAVLLGGEGAVGDINDPLENGSSDSFTDSEHFATPGIVWRPRPPEVVDGKELSAEGIGARIGRQTVPIGLRDLRLNRKFSAPKPGSVALVGYGGGFLAFDDTDAEESRATLYVPYAFSGGVPTKAMSVSLDPEAESMMLVHGDGYAVVLDKDNGITLRGDDSTWLSVKPGKIELVAASISARGSVALGADTSTAVPLLAGAASQPTPSVFFSVT